MSVGYILFNRENFSLYSFFIVPFCQLIFKAFFSVSELKWIIQQYANSLQHALKTKNIWLGWQHLILFKMKRWCTSEVFNNIKVSKLEDLSTYVMSYWTWNQLASIFTKCLILPNYRRACMWVFVVILGHRQRSPWEGRW